MNLEGIAAYPPQGYGNEDLESSAKVQSLSQDRLRPVFLGFYLCPSAFVYSIRSVVALITSKDASIVPGSEANRVTIASRSLGS